MDNSEHFKIAIQTAYLTDKPLPSIPSIASIASIASSPSVSSIPSLQYQQDFIPKEGGSDSIRSVQLSCHSSNTRGSATANWESMFDPFSTFQRNRDSVVYKPWSATPTVLVHPPIEVNLPLASCIPHTPPAIPGNSHFLAHENLRQESCISDSGDLMNSHYSVLQRIRSEGDLPLHPHDTQNTPSSSLDETNSLSLVCREKSIAGQVLQKIQQYAVVRKGSKVKYLSKEYPANPACPPGAIQHTYLYGTSAVNHAPIERLFFWLGFVCPLFWIGGSIGLSKNSARDRDFRGWQRRCRVALMVSLMVIGAVGLVILVQSTWVAGSRQSASESILAVISS
ncbi:hypothetical protein F4703DRAFT_1835406 [Phycomyces blakesleeanus]